MAQRVWEAADGLPQAMLVLAGWKRGDLTLDGLRSIPMRTDDLKSWIEPLYQELTAREQEVARLVAFLPGSADLGLIEAADAHPETTEVTLELLCGRLIVTKSGETYRMHALVRGYVDDQISDTERATFGPRVAGHYQKRARELLLGVDEHPSYGKLYLEAHPDYLANTAQHEQLVDDLMARLAELSLQPGDGDRILVLGSGNGIHDAPFAKYGLRITNLDIQPEMVELGKAAADRLNANIEYVVGDMTHPLDFPMNSMDAVFNIGSSFGYEGEDADNAAVRRSYSARTMRRCCSP